MNLPFPRRQLFTIGSGNGNSRGMNAHGRWHDDPSIATRPHRDWGFSAFGTCCGYRGRACGACRRYYRRLATDVRTCDKIFQKKGKVLTLANRSDTSGSGFIIEGTEIRGKTANCKIKNKKEDGDVVYLLAACATDIMLSDVEMALKIIDKDRVSRFFPGMPEVSSPDYFLCPR
jgi:hypothetical protein